MRDHRSRDADRAVKGYYLGLGRRESARRVHSRGDRDVSLGAMTADDRDVAMSRIATEGRGVLSISTGGSGIGSQQNRAASGGSGPTPSRRRRPASSRINATRLGGADSQGLGVRRAHALDKSESRGHQGYELSVANMLPLEIPARKTRRRTATKKEKLGQKLSTV